MSDQATPASQPFMERESRRASIGRALKRFSTVLKRRNSSNQEVPTTTPLPSRSGLPAPEELPEPAQAAVSPQPTTVALSSLDQQHNIPLEVDDTEDDDLNLGEEPLQPIVVPRANYSEERAKVLRERYGINLQPSGSQQGTSEPPTKVRRIEKPIRIRLHWTCHTCRTPFANDRRCASCGHRRCSDCIRAPPKKVMQILENSNMPQEIQKTREEATAAPVEENLPTETATLLPGEVAASAPLGFSLEVDNNEDDNDTGFPTAFDYAFRLRNPTGVQLVHKPKAQLIRRMCHECQSPIIPATRTDCQQCGHKRCTQCPRYPIKPGRWPSGRPGDEKPMQPLVERVYRKPRQRVRYTCDHCNSIIETRDKCQNCGHARCNDCIRDPPRKPTIAHDPVVVKIVEERLAALGMQHQHRRQPVVAAAS